jgi:hypothetical protein
MVMVPLRVVVFKLAATAKLTVPLPEPLEPAVIVNHETLATAVQAQPVVVVTPTVLDEAVAAAERLLDVSA